MLPWTLDPASPSILPPAVRESAGSADEACVAARGKRVGCRERLRYNHSGVRVRCRLGDEGQAAAAAAGCMSSFGLVASTQ